MQELTYCCLAQLNMLRSAAEESCVTYGDLEVWKHELLVQNYVAHCSMSKHGDEAAEERTLQVTRCPTSLDSG